MISDFRKAQIRNRLRIMDFLLANQGVKFDVNSLSQKMGLCGQLIRSNCYELVRLYPKYFFFRFTYRSNQKKNGKFRILEFWSENTNISA